MNRTFLLYWSNYTPIKVDLKKKKDEERLSLREQNHPGKHVLTKCGGHTWESLYFPYAFLLLENKHTSYLSSLPSSLNSLELFLQVVLCDSKTSKHLTNSMEQKQATTRRGEADEGACCILPAWGNATAENTSTVCMRQDASPPAKRGSEVSVLEKHDSLAFTSQHLRPGTRVCAWLSLVQVFAQSLSGGQLLAIP